METPILPLKDFESLFRDVYEPAEDTFLLLDGLERELERLKTMEPVICLEVGCGSGTVITALRKSLGSNCLYFATDINALATECCLKCASINGITDSSIEAVVTDLTSALEDRLEGKVDLLIFNPPYVLTEEEETKQGKETKPLSFAWAGGTNGMQVTNRFLDKLPKLLSSEGVFFVVLIKENNIPEVMSRLDKNNINSKIIIERRCGREYLFILSGNKRTK